MKQVEKEMIEKFQCPGCTLGGDTDCGTLKFEELGYGMFRCSAHSAGTILMGAGKIALGLPKGFNKVGALSNSLTHRDFSTNIRLVFNPEVFPRFDRINIPVWAMEEKGYLFIRTYCPRINYGYVDVIKGGKIEELCPDTVNPKDFYEEID